MAALEFAFGHRYLNASERNITYSQPFEEFPGGKSRGIWAGYGLHEERI